MANIIIWTPELFGACGLGLRTIYRILSKLNDSIKISVGNDIHQKDFDESDIIILIRPDNLMAYKIASAVKDTGRLLVSFFDDDLMHYSDNSFRRQNYAKKCVKYSDVIWAYNPLLLSDYISMSKGGRGILTNTVVNQEELSRPKRSSDKIEFVYAADVNHEKFFEDIVLPAIPYILNKYGDKVFFNFVGVHPNVNGIIPINKCKFFKPMTIDEYYDFMKNHHFDVGFAPLYDDSFMNRKYSIKYIDYSKSFIVGIYSEVFPFLFAVRQYENGIFAKNRVDDWEKAMEYAINNYEQLSCMAEKAQNDLINNFSLEKAISEIRNKLPEIEEVGREKRNARVINNTVRDTLYSNIDRTADFVLAAKSNGIRYTIDRILNKIHRKHNNTVA